MMPEITSNENGSMFSRLIFGITLSIGFNEETKSFLNCDCSKSLLVCGWVVLTSSSIINRIYLLPTGGDVFYHFCDLISNEHVWENKNDSHRFTFKFLLILRTFPNTLFVFITVVHKIRMSRQTFPN